MSMHRAAHAAAAAALGPLPRSGFLQRKCDCGSHAFAGGTCRQCGQPPERSGLRIGALDDPLEAEADRVSEQVMAAPVHLEAPAAPPAIQRRSVAPWQALAHVPDTVDAVLAGSGAPLATSLRQEMEGRFGRDFSAVRVHADGPAQHSARMIDARAYTAGNHVVFGAGQYAPALRDGRRLIAHELAHVVQQSHRSAPAGLVRRAPLIGPPTQGEMMMDTARTWLDEDALVKAALDVLRAALQEISAGTSVAFNKSAGKKKIDELGVILSLSAGRIAVLIMEWEWLADHHKDAGKDSYKSRAAALLKALRSPLTRRTEAEPKSQAKNWLKNTPDRAMDLLYRVADSELPVDQLYVYAAREGLIKYVRDQLAMGRKDDPTKAQLDTFDTTRRVDGYQYLGADDFMTELDARRQPLRASLPPDVDLSQVREHKNFNEKHREVHSGDFPNLLMALHGIAAVLRRRRKLFLEDAKKHGYATPTTDELVFWTYLYFNTGEFGGEKQLRMHKGKRKLSDWIPSTDFPNPTIVLASYRMLKSMDSVKKMF